MWIRATLVGLALICLAAFSAMSLRLAADIGKTSERYELYGYPAAISMLKGWPHDYTAAFEVAGQFIFHRERPINERLAAARNVPIEQSREVWFIPGDDKGMIDVAVLAMLLFGVDRLAVAKFTLLIIACSFLLYAAAWYREPRALVLLVAIGCGLYVVGFTFGITDQAGEIAEPRFTEGVALVAALHLMLEVVFQRRLTLWRALACAAQAGILFFLLHARSTVLWEIMAIELVAVFALVVWRSYRQAIFVLVLFSCLFIASNIYKSISYNSKYFEGNTATRVVWHNALMGLAINSALAGKYGIRAFDDRSITEAVRKSVPEPERSQIFPSDIYSNGNFAGFAWAPYERWARVLLFDIVRNDLSEVMRTYLIEMPSGALQMASYLATGRTYGKWTRPAGIYATNDRRASYDLFFLPFRILPLTIAIATGIVVALGGIRVSPATALASTAFVMSAIPWMLASPAIQYMQTSLVLGTALLFLLIAGAVSAILQMQIWRSLGARLFLGASR